MLLLEKVVLKASRPHCLGIQGNPREVFCVHVIVCTPCSYKAQKASVSSGHREVAKSSQGDCFPQVKASGTGYNISQQCPGLGPKGAADQWPTNHLPKYTQVELAQHCQALAC